MGLAATILAGLWLAALGIGMLGLGRLPGVPLPPLGKLHRAKASPKVEPANASIVRDAKVVPARFAVSPDRARARPGRGRSAGAGSARRSATKAPTVPSAPQPAPLPQPKQTGWARRGLATPPGQARRTQPPPGQQRAQGLNHGQAKKTATPLPPPAPPGHQKPPKKA